jgi:hypothetical protein
MGFRQMRFRPPLPNPLPEGEGTKKSILSLRERGQKNQSFPEGREDKKIKPPLPQGEGWGEGVT